PHPHHLYFNPKTHKDGIPVRPIESTIHASTTKILWPIFDDKCKDTTIIDGTSLNTELSKYNKKGLLKPTTLFCTFDIHDANTWHPNIKLDYKINKSLPFLDLLLTNNNGILATSVYHKPAAEPYITPFTSDHPRHVFANII
ncbi:unnamed protein product, partial [Rotaria socialis]